MALAWFDKELLENARDLSLLLASCWEVTGKGSHNCRENPLCGKAAYPGGAGWLLMETVEPPPPLRVGGKG